MTWLHFLDLWDVIVFQTIKTLFVHFGEIMAVTWSHCGAKVHKCYKCPRMRHKWRANWNVMFMLQYKYIFNNPRLRSHTCINSQWHLAVVVDKELGARLTVERVSSVSCLYVKDADNGLLSAITEAVVPLRPVWFATRQYSGLCFLLKTNYPHKTEPCMCAEALHKSSRDFSGGNLASLGTRSHFPCLKAFNYGIGREKFLP